MKGHQISCKFRRPFHHYYHSQSLQFAGRRVVGSIVPTRQPQAQRLEKACFQQEECLSTASETSSPRLLTQFFHYSSGRGVISCLIGTSSRQRQCFDNTQCNLQLFEPQIKVNKMPAHGGEVALDLRHVIVTF